MHGRARCTPDAKAANCPTDSTEPRGSAPSAPTSAAMTFGDNMVRPSRKARDGAVLCQRERTRKKRPRTPIFGVAKQTSETHPSVNAGVMAMLQISTALPCLSMLRLHSSRRRAFHGVLEKAVEIPNTMCVGDHQLCQPDGGCAWEGVRITPRTKK